MIYRFADFQIDPATYSLTRGDEAVRLEPRVFDLLIFLLERRERVVTKDELFSEVWQGQAVSDSVLTRAVYELRRALGDDSKRPEWIVTVHGRGYRFAGEAEVVPDELSEAKRPRKSTGPIPGAAAEPTASPATGSGVMSHRLVWIGLVALLTVVALGLVLWIAGRSPEAAPETEDSEIRPLRMAILPFASGAEDSTLDLLSLSMTDLLWARLASDPELVVHLPDYSGDRELTAASMGAYMRDTGVTAVITGRIEPIGRLPRARLAVELYREDDDGSVETLLLGAYDVPHLTGDDDLLRFTRIRERIAESVLENLGGAFSLAPSDGTSPKDPEAYRLYLQARARLLDMTCGDREWVVDLLDQSLRLDPDFAMAWLAQGFAHYSQLWSCGREAEYALEALTAAERAYELAPGLGHALFLQVAVLTDLGRPEEAWRRLEAGAKYPSPQNYVARAYVLRHVGLLREAKVAVEQAVELDLLVFEELGEMPLTLLYGGDLDAFLAQVPGLDSPYNLFYRGLVDVRRGRPEVARELLEPAFRLNPNDLFARYASVLLAVLEGDRAAAGDIARQVVHQRRTLGAAGGELTYKEGQLLAFAGDLAGALEQIELAVEQGFFCAPCMVTDPLLAPLAADPAFRAAVERAEVRQREFLDAVDWPSDSP